MSAAAAWTAHSRGRYTVVVRVPHPTAPAPLPRRRHPERHLGDRAGWLRAAVLGANDGLLSVSSLILGVAASGASRGSIILAGIAALVAGALSMAAGEYVSVSSQRDSEVADLTLEARELADDPVGELRELALIYEGRGLSTDLARRVAEQLSRGDSLAAHARDELGLADARMSRPWQAAWASAAAFTAGAAVPVLCALAPRGARATLVVAVTLAALCALGAIGARLGGAPMRRAAVRVGLWGAGAMGLTAAIGALVGTAV